MTSEACFQLLDRSVGPGNPCLIVAEIGQAHDGSLGQAHAYIDAVAEAGADAVKFQTHIAAAESTPGEPFRIKFSKQDATRYDYWKRMEFTEEQWVGLRDHAEERGLGFLSTPFSFKAFELLERLGIPAWKVGSGETSNTPLLECMAQTGKPVLLSSGMSSWSELDAAVECVTANGASVGVYQCTTAYPCPPTKWGLNVLAEMRARYGCPVGFSDHSGTVAAGVAAAALGANMLEVHVVFSKACFGPDTSSSLTTPDLARLVEEVRLVETALGSPMDKDANATELSPLRKLFTKSLVAARSLATGHRLTREDLGIKKPGTGIPAARLNEVVGRTLSQPVEANELLKEAHLD